MTKQTSPSGTAAWLLASAGLCAAIVFQLNNDSLIAVPVTAAPADLSIEVADGSVVESFVAPDIALLDEIVGRPLFSASRQPFKVMIDQTSEAALATVTVLPFQLAGTMLSGDARFALLAHPERGMLRLREGQDVDGWRIDDIDVNEVFLTNGEETMRLRLQKVVPPARLEQSAHSAAGGLETGDIEAVERQKE